MQSLTLVKMKLVPVVLLSVASLGLTNLTMNFDLMSEVNVAKRTNIHNYVHNDRVPDMRLPCVCNPVNCPSAHMNAQNVSPMRYSRQEQIQADY